MVICNKKILALSVLCAVVASGVANSANTSKVGEKLSSFRLEDIVVTASEGRHYYAGKQVVRESNFGVMGNLDFMDIPINAISFSGKSIKSQKSPGSTFLKVVTQDPSVISSGTNTYNDITIRGFYISPHDYYINGVPGMMSQSSIPVNFVDSIEVISGPNTLINGVSTSGSVGGAVNLVPKTAGDKPEITVAETFSGRSHFEHALDVGYRFGKDKAWGVKITADHADGNTVHINEKMKSDNFFVNVDHHGKKSRSSLLYGFRSVDQKAPNLPLYIGEHAIPKPPDGNANFQLPWSQYIYNNHMILGTHEQDLGKNWQWFIKGGYHDEDWNRCMESYYPELLNDKGDFLSYIEDVPIKFWRRSVVSGFKGEAQTGNLTHNIVISADKLWEKGKGADWFPEDEFYGNIYDQSIASPKNKRPFYKLGSWYNSGELTLSGISLIDRIVTQDDKFHFLLGLRRQSVESRSSYKDGHYTKHGKKSATSPSFGVMYKVNPRTAFYANYIEGLSKGRFVGPYYANKNEFMEPQKTQQYEVGLKLDHKNLATVLSAFQIEQENAYADKKTNIYGYFGRKRNKGVQLTMYGKPAAKWNIVGGLMYLNSRQRGGDADGKYISGTPKWHSTLSVEYECDERFSLNGHFQYSGTAYCDSKNTKKVPSWYTFDLGAGYKTKLGNTDVTLGLDVYNVFNKHYWYADGGNTLFLGDARTAVVSAEFKF